MGTRMGTMKFILQLGQAVLLFFFHGASLGLAASLEASIIDDANVATGSKFVLTFGPATKIETVEQIVLNAGVTSGRFLKCTRGLLLAVDPSSNHLDALNRMLLPDMKLMPHGAHPSLDDTDKNESDPQGKEEQLVSSGSTFQRRLGGDRRHETHVKSDRTASDGISCDTCPPMDNIPEITTLDVTRIKEEIKSSLGTGENGAGSFAGSLSNSLGELLRLVFHDVSAFDIKSVNDLSGLNGCVNMDFPSNAGLTDAFSFLLFVRFKTKVKISMADMIVLGAITAIEEGGGPVIPFRYGRIDVPCKCETDFFPDPESEDALVGTGELDATMRDRNGLTRREITALLGSHTFGGLEPFFSGYSGGWIPPANRSTFNNLYYVVMLNRPWVKTTVESRLEAGKNLTEWRSPLVEIDAMMLNIDAVLGFHIHDGCNVFGLDPHNFIGTGGENGTPADFVPETIVNCTLRDDEYGQAVEDFAANNTMWREEYEAAFIKMVEDTVPCKPGDLKVPRDVTGGDSLF